MKLNEGRLQTGEHILARIIQNRIPDAKVVIARFDKDTEGCLDMTSVSDLRLVANLEAAVNAVIKANLRVVTTELPRDQASKEFDISKIPESAIKIRVIEIEGFDRRTCRDPHTMNTSDVGVFRMIKIEKAGKDRYRFIFTVTDK